MVQTTNQIVFVRASQRISMEYGTHMKKSGGKNECDLIYIEHGQWKWKIYGNAWKWKNDDLDNIEQCTRTHITSLYMAMGQNRGTLVNIKIDGIYGCSSTQIWYNRF